MVYSPKTWSYGTRVYYTDLDNIEDGIQEALQQHLMYTGDETVVQSTGGAWATVKTHRMIRSSHYGYNVKEIFMVAELRTSGASGVIGLFIDGAATPAIRLGTNNAGWPAYDVLVGSTTVAWADNSVHDIAIKIADSAGGTVYNRTYQVYVRQW